MNFSEKYFVTSFKKLKFLVFPKISNITNFIDFQKHKPLVCCSEASESFGAVALSRMLPSLSASNIEAADKEAEAVGELRC